MRVSKKTDYALRVLFTLVEHHGRGPIPIRELARRNEIPKRFLEHILLDLKAQGWVNSVPGKAGGYVLIQKPEKIRLGQVVRLFDNLLSPVNCVSAHQHEGCSQEPVCRFRRVFLQIRNDTARLMDNVTLASVFAGRPVSQHEVFEDALIGGAGI